MGSGGIVEPTLNTVDSDVCDDLDHASETAAIHSGPWSNIGVTFDSTPPSGDERGRYHRLRFLLDYMRRGAVGAGNSKQIPVALEESGYPVCTEAQETSISNSSMYDTRENVQFDVVGRVALAIAEVQANGGLYFTYRDRFDSWRWGAVALDDSQNLIYPDLPLSFTNIRIGRGSTLATQGTAVSVDPFAEVDFYGSLLQSMASYKTQAGNSNGSVEITVPTEPGSP